MDQRTGLSSWVAAVPRMAAGYHLNLIARVEELRTHRAVYPPPDCVFRAFELVPFDRVRVVILGQDPYHGEGQAHGLAFSVPEGVPTPPSLRNIFKEVARDVEGRPLGAYSRDLTRWARQGVLLLNAILTVEAGAPGAHRDLGWQTLTDDVISALSARRDHLVFMLWGRFAQSKEPMIDAVKHLVLTAAHPSPLSARRGFLGSGHFSKANAYLEQHGILPVDWTGCNLRA